MSPVYMMYKQETCQILFFLKKNLEYCLKKKKCVYSAHKKIDRDGRTELLIWTSTLLVQILSTYFFQ